MTLRVTISAEHLSPVGAKLFVCAPGSGSNIFAGENIHQITVASKLEWIVAALLAGISIVGIPLFLYKASQKKFTILNIEGHGTYFVTNFDQKETLSSEASKQVEKTTYFFSWYTKIHMKT